MTNDSDIYQERAYATSDTDNEIAPRLHRTRGCKGDEDCVIIVTVFNKRTVQQCPVNPERYRQENIKCDDGCTQEYTAHVLRRRDCIQNSVVNPGIRSDQLSYT